MQFFRDQLLARKSGLRETRYKLASLVNFKRRYFGQVSYDEATREAVGFIQMPGCVYELRVQRSMDRQGLRLTSSPTLPSAIHDWEDKEVRLRWSEGNTSPGELFFLFAGEPNDVCPERFGNVYVFRNSIVAEFSDRFDAVATHELASATTDVFSVKKGHCEYLIKVKQYASSEGG